LSDAIDEVSRAFGRTLDQGQKKGLLLYFSNLHQWNRSINLTGIKDDRELVYKHLGDTLILDTALDKECKTLLDIGTGAGIPGLIMKILRPDLYVVLAEALKKKCSFLRYMASVLNFRKGLYIEEKKLGPSDPPENMPSTGFDAIVSQATGSLSWLVDLSEGFLARHGNIFALKGPKVQKELPEAEKVAREKGLEIEMKEYTLPILGHERVLVIFKRAR